MGRLIEAAPEDPHPQDSPEVMEPLSRRVSDIPDQPALPRTEKGRLSGAALTFVYF